MIFILSRTHRFIGVEGDEQGVGKTHAIASVLKFKAKQVAGTIWKISVVFSGSPFSETSSPVFWGQLHPSWSSGKRKEGSSMDLNSLSSCTRCRKWSEASLTRSRTREGQSTSVERLTRSTLNDALAKSSSLYQVFGRQHLFSGVEELLGDNHSRLSIHAA